MKLPDMVEIKLRIGRLVSFYDRPRSQAAEAAKSEKS